jgi:hypothetical protein
MTREAALEGFERFVAEAVDATRREFSVGRALRGTGLGVGGAVVDRLRENTDALERRVVEPELRTYRDRSVDQFEVVLDYVESDDPIDAFERELVEADSYLESLDPAASAATRQAVEDDVVGRLERLGDAVEPVVDHPADDFWGAVTGAFDRAEAHRLVEDTFPFTDPLRRHRRAFAFTVDIDPADVLGGVLSAGLPSVSIDYTDEALRAMVRAEQHVVTDTKSTIDDQFGP